jgi:hypothetical protein
VVPYVAKTYAFYTRSTTYKNPGAPDQRSLIQQKVYTFYTRSTAYKKQGAPDRRYFTQQKQGAPDQHSTHLLLLSARAPPRTKSKGLYRYVLQIDYFINQDTSRI